MDLAIPNVGFSKAANSSGGKDQAEQLIGPS